MIKQLDDFLVGMVIGIRFRANFSVEDQIGRILDTILYSHGAFFGPKVFPAVSGNVGQRVLINRETDDKLTIDNSNLVLDVQFTGPPGFQKTDSQAILAAFENDIIKGVMSKFGITQLGRVGLIKRYVFPMSNLAASFVDKTIGKTLEGVNDINLRFSKKLPVPKALVKRDVHDYANAIFNIIKKADADEIFMSVDYQLHFSPLLEHAGQLKFMPFAQSAEHFNRNKYLPWLNSNYVEEHNEQA